MGTMQRTIEPLTLQVAEMKREAGNKTVDKDQDMPTIYRKEVEKRPKYVGPNGAAGHMDFISFL